MISYYTYDGTKSYFERTETMSDKLHDKIYQINCLTEEVDSLYHQAALKLGGSDSVMWVL